VQEVGDEAWDKLTESSKNNLAPARALLLKLKANQTDGKRAIAKYDDSAEKFGRVPLDDASIKKWVVNELEQIKPYRIREQQSVDVKANHVLAVDHCPRLGKTVQMPPGAQHNAQVACFTAAYHQICAPILVNNGKYDEVKPAVVAAVDSGRWVPTALSVDDQGAAVSWHGHGQHF